MLDHVLIGVADLERSGRFYAEALAPLGVREVLRHPTMIGFGSGRMPEFVIRAGGGQDPVHIAFAVSDRAAVDRFHEAAISAGGRDNGAPGVRDYHPRYYGAFALDPDGHNVEAVCHR